MSLLSRSLVGEVLLRIDQEVKLQGWVDTKRDHGKITFIDLRDRTGKVQCVAQGLMGNLTPESVVEIIGTVKHRPDNLINANEANGAVEIAVTTCTVLNKARELPIQVSGDGREVAEEVRLRYRYLDLRRERMRQMLKLRSDYVKALRQALDERAFTEVETPMLTKSTKEGARDFVVPSRFQPGKFYALPQSPQQYKQLLMTAGVERYFQFARCIRDEDLRADRGFEHTQVDLEMSFVEREDVMTTVEAIVKQAVAAVGGKLQQQQFPVFTYQEAIAKFGADKFDLRSDQEKQDGVLAFAWVVDFPFFKKVDVADVAEVRDGKSGWTFTHNPFSQPKAEHLDWHLAGTHLDEILTTQYDLVCNGFEAGGGSIRAHDPAVVRATFTTMGYSEAQIQDSVGHMLEAFEVGTPPHGGIALGLDRHIMILANETSLKEAIAFPMTASGRTAVMTAPSPISQEQLTELSISVMTENEAGLTPHDYIIDKLQRSGVSYRYLAHEPVRTSAESAQIRGGSESQGAKALVLQADKEFILHVLPGNKRANLEALTAFLGVKKLAMASKDSIEAKTGLEVGSIPPFGSSLGMKTYVDPDLSQSEEIAFNVGRLDRSIVMKYSDYIAVEKPILVV